MDRDTVMSCLEGIVEDDDWSLFHSDSEVRNIAKMALDLLKDSVSIDVMADFLSKYAVPPEKLTHGYSIGDSKQAWIRFMRKNL